MDGAGRRLRRQLGEMAWGPWLLGLLLSLWVRLCHATTRWERLGESELEAALREGPVILVLWHERIAMVGIHWRPDWGPLAAIHTTRFVGRVAGAAQAQLGLRPIAFHSRQSNLAASREAMRRLRAGEGVGITGDGPRGPARELKDAPIDWACASGRPVFVYAFATRRHRRLRSWDRMLWPLPFTRGAAVWRRWDAAPPRRPDPATRAALRHDLAARLDAVAEEADARVR